MKNDRTHRRWRGLHLALVLALALCPAALADTDGTEPKITQQPAQLVLQLGPGWAGVEFELRTDAGAYPAPVVVDETGVLTMDLGGSSTYTLSCLGASPATPPPTPGPAAAGAVLYPSPAELTTPPSDTAPAQIPMSQVIFFLVVLVIAAAGLVLLFLSKRRRARTNPEWDDDDEEL